MSLRACCALAALVAAAACATHSAVAPGSTPSAAARAAPALDIAYRIAMPDPPSHLYELQLDVGGVGSIEPVRLQLPVWSPGRYARMDFARTVQDFAATTDDGRPLRWDKENGSLWRVYPGGAARIRARYRVYANTLSGTFSVLDTAHANWNGASLFMYVEGHKPDPVRLTVAPPAGWHVINGWSERPDQTEFRFPNYDVFIDTPTEVAPSFDVDTFRADGVLYRVVVHRNGGGALANEARTRARFLREVEKLVRYENRVIAPPPITTYTFLFNIGYRGRDGMEHLNSTQIMTTAAWTDTATLLPGVSSAAHEYFHTWNVKRIRPAALGPFDYTREQYEPSLWVAEGWTNYYGNIALHRAGIIDRPTFYERTAAMLGDNLESPGRKAVSARMSSFEAPFWDGAATQMETNFQGAWFSYYTKGEGLALVLDLTIRSRTGGAKALDDVLRLVRQRTWEAPSTSYYLQGRGYTEDDIERAVSDVIGTDMHPWFERYVATTEDPPFAETLALAGLRLVASGGAGADRQYRIEEAPDATDAQRRVREGWLSGTTSAPR